MIEKIRIQHYSREHKVKLTLNSINISPNVPTESNSVSLSNKGVLPQNSLDDMYIYHIFTIMCRDLNLASHAADIWNDKIRMSLWVVLVFYKFGMAITHLDRTKMQSVQWLDSEQSQLGPRVTQRDKFKRIYANYLQRPQP